jgi:hypothetical protein
MQVACQPPVPSMAPLGVRSHRLPEDQPRMLSSLEFRLRFQPAVVPVCQICRATDADGECQWILVGEPCRRIWCGPTEQATVQSMALRILVAI